MTTYEADRAEWSLEQARLLQGRRTSIDAVDIAHEIERLGRNDTDALRERIRVLLSALLRWAYEVDIRSVALDATIFTQRREIGRLLEESPSLAPLAQELVIEMYPTARHSAAIENGPFEDAFPAGLPFLPDEVFDEDFLPDPYGDDLIRGPKWWRNR